MACDKETYRGFRRNIRFGRPAKGNNNPTLRRSIWASYKSLVNIRNLLADKKLEPEARMELEIEEMIAGTLLARVRRDRD